MARGTAHDLSRLDVPPAPPAGSAEERSPVRVAALLRKVGGCEQVWKAAAESQSFFYRLRCLPVPPFAAPCSRHPTDRNIPPLQESF